MLIGLGNLNPLILFFRPPDHISLLHLSDLLLYNIVQVSFDIVPVVSHPGVLFQPFIDCCLLQRPLQLLQV